MFFFLPHFLWLRQEHEPVAAAEEAAVLEGRSQVPRAQSSAGEAQGCDFSLN